MSGTVLQSLAEDYPQLYMNPNQFSQEDDQSVVRRGEDPPVRSLAHYQGDPGDRLETEETPSGPVRVATLGNRQDFERVIRSLMAAL